MEWLKKQFEGLSAEQKGAGMIGAGLAIIMGLGSGLMDALSAEKDEEFSIFGAIGSVFNTLFSGIILGGIGLLVGSFFKDEDNGVGRFLRGLGDDPAETLEGVVDEVTGAARLKTDQAIKKIEGAANSVRQAAEAATSDFTKWAEDQKNVLDIDGDGKVEPDELKAIVGKLKDEGIELAEDAGASIEAFIAGLQKHVEANRAL